MRLATPSTRSGLEHRREQSRRRRAAAPLLGNLFPAVGQVSVQLRFLDWVGRSPCSQLHMVYPPAPAYFEFACPYGDCDGAFDLNEIARELMRDSMQSTDGTIVCPGTRTGAALTRQPCGLRAAYRITAHYEAASDPAE
jgi:hypothetical protein